MRPYNQPYEGHNYTKQFDLWTAMGQHKNVKPGVILGEAINVTAANTPSEIWLVGNVYTGFNAVGDESTRVVSTINNDNGTLVTQGIIDEGSKNTLFDADVDFIAAGVAVGDIILNDTQAIHGIITSVATNTLVVYRMETDNRGVHGINNKGDAYRIATTADTGLAVLKLYDMLNFNRERIPSQFVIMNGFTFQDLNFNASWWRSKGVLFGSNGSNLGLIFTSQSPSTANFVSFINVGMGQSLDGVSTVPIDSVRRMRSVSISMSTATGVDGRATVKLSHRPFGEGGFVTSWICEITTQFPVHMIPVHGDIYGPGTDLKFTIIDVSVDGSRFTVQAEYDDLIIHPLQGE